jgi:hypothetical protein
MNEKRVAKTREVTSRSGRDARGPVVWPGTAAVDDGGELGMMTGSEQPSVGRVVRPGDSYPGRQGLDYTPGVSAETDQIAGVMAQLTEPSRGARTHLDRPWRVH